MSDTINFALHEIGARDAFSRDLARRMARDFVDSLTAFPNAEHMLVVGGYDTDPRELWDIPEARAYIREFAGWVALMLPGRKIADWRLDQYSLALVAICTGAGTLTGRDPVTGVWTIAVGRPPS